MKIEKFTKLIAILTVTCALLGIISAFFSPLLALYLYKFNQYGNGAASTAVIGGADGPTAIYLAGQSSFNWLTAIFALLSILGIIYLAIARHKKVQKP